MDLILDRHDFPNYIIKECIRFDYMIKKSKISNLRQFSPKILFKLLFWNRNLIFEKV